MEFLLSGGKIRCFGIAAVVVAVALPHVAKILRSVVKAAMCAGASIGEQVNVLVEEVKAEEGMVVVTAAKTVKRIEAKAGVEKPSIAKAAEMDIEGMTVSEFDEAIANLKLAKLLSLEEAVSQDTRKGVQDAWHRAQQA